MQKETYDAVHYYSARLLKKLELVLESEETFISAPAGFGKTTAVRDLFKRAEQRNELMKAEWITAFDEPDDKLSLRILNAFEKMSSIIDYDTKVFLVIDNIELLPMKFMQMILEEIKQRRKYSIHLIMISNCENNCPYTETEKKYNITRADFIFSKVDIKDYFQTAETTISMEDAAKLYEYTKGWIAAIYLQLLSYKRTGDILHSGAAVLLMKSVVWDTLLPDEKDLLLSIAPFRKVTEKEIAYILNEKEIPSQMSQLLDKVPFIQKRENPIRYEIHTILQELLMERLAEGNEEKRKEIEIKAGDCFKEQGKLEDAICLFWQNYDYERILAIDMRHLACARGGDVRFSHLAEDILINCSESVIARHPYNALKMVLNLCGKDTRQLQKDFMQHLYLIFAKMNIKEEEKTHLLGEWNLIYALTLFPDMDAMLVKIKEANEMLQGKSEVIEREDPFIFEVPMLLLIAHVASGDLIQTVEKFEEVMNIYSIITDGNGSGVGALLRAEAALCKGFYEEAVLYCYKAAYLAGSNQQKGVLHATQAMLSLVGICMGGKEGLEPAYRLLNSFQLEDDKYRNEEELAQELIERTVYFIMGADSGLDSVIEDKDSNICMPWTVVIMGKIKNIYTLFRNKQYEEAIKMGETIVERLSLVGAVYALILVETILALSYTRLGKVDLSKEKFMKAFSLGMPDGFILPFIMLWQQITGMVCTWDKSVAEEFLKRETVMRIDHMAKDFEDNWKYYCGEYLEKNKASDIKHN